MKFKSLRWVIALVSLCIAAHTPALHAQRILWDASHVPIQGYIPDTEYRQLADLLRQRGYRLATGEIPAHRHGLWDVDILVVSVLSNWESAYTAPEAGRISHFVAAGGGLIILADNSQARPGNLTLLLEAFGVQAARGDDIDTLFDFAELPLFDGVERVGFERGGALDADEELGAEAVAFDANELAGVVVNQNWDGVVVLIGDADLWTNRNLARHSNAAFALNCFEFVVRDPLGSVVSRGEGSEFYLPQDAEYHKRFQLLNEGEGVLEIGTSIEDDPQWVSAAPSLAAIPAGDSVEIDIAFDLTGMAADTTLDAHLVIDHNDPDHEPITVDYTIRVVPSQPQHFNVPRPTGSDHSLLASAVLIDGEAAPTGIEVGVFTTAGLCAGGSIYAGGQLGIVARGDDPLTEEIDGFHRDEPFTFRYYIPWDDREIEAHAEFLQGAHRFRNDGLSILRLNGLPVTELAMRLNLSWNLVSFNVYPADQNPRNIFIPLLDRGMLRMIKDQDGRFWDVRMNFSNLEDWTPRAGYEVNVLQPVSMRIEGFEIDPLIPIPLREGWSIAPYLLQESRTIDGALGSLGESIILIKRDDGAFYAPQWDWDGIGRLEPGEAYKIKLNARDTLIYPAGDGEVDFSDSPAAMIMKGASGHNMSVLLLGLDGIEAVRAVGGGEALAGGVKELNADRAGFPVQGDDPLTSAVEGLKMGERFAIRAMRSRVWVELDVDWLHGDAYYTDDELAVGRIVGVETGGTKHEFKCVPNPFNDRFQIEFSQTPRESLKLRIFDVAGRMLWSRDVTGGLNFDARALPAGILILRAEGEDWTRSLKVLHLP